MREVFGNFRYRKLVLAIADAFIIAVASLITNYILSFASADLSQDKVSVSMGVSVICCISSLLICGAYSKLWRYFNKKDYLCCVYGIVAGITVSALIVYIVSGKLFLTYALIHCIIALIGVCLFRYMFKRTFISLTSSEICKGKRTMFIGDSARREYWSSTAPARNRTNCSGYWETAPKPTSSRPQRCRTTSPDCAATTLWS